MQLTEHFSLAEFTRSTAAEHLGDANEPTMEHLVNLRVLAGNLEKVRRVVGKGISIASAYRNPRVNAAVGGVTNSDHALGHAADIHVAGMTDLALAKVIRDSGIKFDQLILEGTAAKPRCVHISFAPRMRQQVLRQPGGPGSAVYSGLEA